MSWNDQRVELLSKLWLEGRSASQIANELGQNITRNAVIGKVHRLGLSGRAKVAAAAARLRPKPQPKPEFEASTSVVEAAPAEAPVRSDPVAAPAPRPIADVVIPFSNRVTIMELRETMCRWPIGDPTSAEFRYCGCRTGDVGPYCQDHARLAFQPTQERRRVERFARIA